MAHPNDTTAGECADRAQSIVYANTSHGRAALVPEIALLLATDPRGIFQVAREAGHLPPFWAYAWPGGQALARHVLDQPALVAGRRVLDIGAGSGIIALAAARAGAAQVVAADIDPLSVMATAMNAGLNDLTVATCGEDLLDGTADADVVLAGDVAYESPLKERVEAFLGRARKSGADVFIADRSRLPASAAFRALAEYDTVVAPPLLVDFNEPATVWQAR